jgi:DNA-binding LacI/PurR family transcriptional regulator
MHFNLSTPGAGAMVKPQKRITLEDVAQEAGVSISTASRALKQHEAISENTRDRVAAAAEALDYQQPVRRSLPDSNPRTIAILVTDIRNPHNNSILQGLEDETGYNDTNLVLMTTRNDPLREQQVVERLTTMPLDGIVIMNSSCLPVEKILEIQSKRELPSVIFNYALEHPHIGCIIPDTRLAAYRTANYLISLGHTRIAYAGPRNRTSDERQQGVEQALRNANLDIDPALIIKRNIGDETRGMRAMEELLSLDVPPTAVVAFNDIMAYGVMHVIYKAGLQIPNDISVIGFDDVPTSAYVIPPLSTVALPAYRMGQLAMHLLRRIEAGTDMRLVEPIILESPLIIRESTGLVPK